MGFKRVAVAALLMVALVAMAGCSKSAPKENPARAVAVEYYRNMYLQNGDPGRAWDLMLADQMWGRFAGTREEFVAARKSHSDAGLLPADTPLQVQEFDRAGDYLYLIKDKREGRLLWVTKTAQGWQVRKAMDWQEGMIIPWS